MSLQSLFEAYHEEIQFLMIYIREAHPVDGWWFGHGLVSRMIRFYSPLTSFRIHDPKTIEERRTAAKQCQGALQFGIKTYVDDMEDSVSKAYAAKPTRYERQLTSGRNLHPNPGAARCRLPVHARHYTLGLRIR